MRVLWIVALLPSLLPAALPAQVPGFASPAPAKPSAVTIGFMHAIHATNEVEKIDHGTDRPRHGRDDQVLERDARMGAEWRQAVLEGSSHGQRVNWSQKLQNVFAKDPNGLNIELVGEAKSRLS